MKLQFGYPHRLTIEGLKGINEFAESELTVMVTSGKHTGDASLPLTDTQRARAKGEKKAEEELASRKREQH